jgi:Lar family restriction alleviation protein
MSNPYPVIADDLTGELEDCPFCGRGPYRLWNKNVDEAEEEASWVVTCSYCCADGPPADTHAGAVKAWNERA